MVDRVNSQKFSFLSVPHGRVVQSGKALIFAVSVIASIGAVVMGFMAAFHVPFIGGLGAIAIQGLLYGGCSGFTLSVIAMVLNQLCCYRSKDMTQLPNLRTREQEQPDSEENLSQKKPGRDGLNLIEEGLSLQVGEDNRSGLIILGDEIAFPEEIKRKEARLSENEKKILNEATKALVRVKSMVNAIDIKKIDHNQLKRAQQLLESDRAIKDALLHSSAEKDEENEDAFAALVRDYDDQLGRIQSFQTYQQKILKIDEQGEGRVEADGNCMFATFISHEKFKNGNYAYNQDEVDQVRATTVDWMVKNHKTDKTLQYWLHLSVTEHFENVILNLESERETAQFLAEDQEIEKDQKQFAESRLKSIPQEIQAAKQKIYKEDGESLKEYGDFGPDLDLYFDEISNPGVFGGLAELYALSQLYKKNIHVKTRKNKPCGGMSESECEYGNFPSSETYTFKLEGKHYTPLFFSV